MSQAVRNFFYQQQVKDKKVNGNPWTDLTASLTKPPPKPVKLPLFRFMMKQDDYRPLVETEYLETWDPEEFDENSQLAWRCTCAKAVLARLSPDERVSLETRLDVYTALRKEEWEVNNIVEESTSGEIDEDKCSMYVC